MTRQEFGWLAFGLIIGFLVWEEWRGHGCTGCSGKRATVTAPPITVTATPQTPVSSFPPPCGGRQ